MTEISTATSSELRIASQSPVARFSLRMREGDRTALGQTLGLDLPGTIGRRTTAGDREALCLGPDEWLLLAPEDERTAITDAAGRVYADHPHSLTEISDRELTILVEGAQAEELLSFACPRDLGRLEPSHGVRTVFDGVSVVLWRDAADRFRLDVWRSFASHVRELLEIGAEELALGL